MKNKVKLKLDEYIKNLAQPTTSLKDLSKLGLSSAAALAAVVSVPVELSSQVVCGNIGSPTRTVGSCIGGTGNLGQFYTNYCAKFDFDGDGINELQVRYYAYNGVYPAGYFYIDPLQGTQMWSVRIDPNFGDAFPAYAAANYGNYNLHYSDKIFIVPLSAGAGFGFVAIDSDLYNFADGNHTGSHPITSQAICCWAYGEVIMWGADTGIEISDFMVISDDMTDCGNISPVLPVELLSFNARSNEDFITLEWSTAIEINNAGFSVQRSIDGRNFSDLAFVKGNDNTTQIQHYNFVDEDTKPNQLYYYRLKQIDYDGAFNLSEIVQAEIKSDDIDIYVHPNPSASGETLIRFENNADKKQVKFLLYSSVGELVWSKDYKAVNGQNEIRINEAELAPGVYFLKNDLNHQAQYTKLVIQ